MYYNIINNNNDDNKVKNILLFSRVLFLWTADDPEPYRNIVNIRYLLIVLIHKIQTQHVLLVHEFRPHRNDFHGSLLIVSDFVRAFGECLLAGDDALL